MKEQMLAAPQQMGCSSRNVSECNREIRGVPDRNRNGNGLLVSCITCSFYCKCLIGMKIVPALLVVCIMNIK